MLKAVAVAGLTLALWGLSAGCDELAAGGAAAELGKVISAAKPLQAGSGIMDPIQQRDRLRDGTGLNCPGGTGGSAGSQQGTGQGDQSRRREGSCQ